MWSRALSGSSFKSTPMSVAEPDVARDSVDSTRNSVVLPAPFGPMSEITLPRRKIDRNVVDHGCVFVGLREVLDAEHGEVFNTVQKDSVTSA